MKKLAPSVQAQAQAQAQAQTAGGSSAATGELPTPARADGFPATLWAARALAAVALIVVGGVHLQQYTVAHFSLIPTIGPLFLVNFVVATSAGLILLVPIGPGAGPVRRGLEAVAALAGLGVSLGAFAALLISEQTPLFGFMEHGYRPEIVLALIAEAIVIAALAVVLGPFPHRPTNAKEYPMNRLRLSILAVIIAAVVGVAVATTGGAAKTGHPSATATSGITVRQTPLGKAIADANGRSLYLFAGDRPNRSTLSAAGQAVWPLYTSTSRSAASGGATASMIATTKTHGAHQITYNGHPLYYYVGDHRPGDTNGQDLNQFGARWYLLKPTGTAITTTPHTPARPASSSGAYGY